MSVITLDDIIKKYDYHPYFIGMNITDPNQPGAIDDALIHIVAHCGDISELDILIAHGGDVNLKGDMGFTPLHYAAISGRKDMVQHLLLHGADIHALNEWGETPLKVAEQGGHAEIANILRRRK